MAFFVVSSGQVVSGNTLDGGYEIVESGGKSIDTTIIGGGTLTDYGYISGTSVQSGLLDIVGSAAATTVGSGGLAVIEGTATGVAVTAGGYAIVTPGSHATNVTANGGTVISTGNALVAGSVVLSAAATLTGVGVGRRQTLYTLSDGVTNGLTFSGGTQEVFAGGSANATTIEEGSQAVIGGYASGTTVGTFANSGFGATQIVASGGITDASTIQYGGQQMVESGGLARGSIVSSGGQANVYGGTMRNAEIGDGGIAYVYSGAFNAGTVDSGGLVLVLNGTDAGNTVAAGGHLIDSGVAVLSNTGSGTALVESATQVTGFVVSAGERAYVLNGGTTTGTKLTGGSEDIYGGGVTTGTVMSYSALSGGLLQETIHSGGIASGTQVDGGQQLIVGGTAVGAFVVSATQSILAGSATDTTIGADARQYVLSSGVARRTIVSSGGSEFVGVTNPRFGYGQSGGTAVSTTIEGGGSLEVVNGGVVRDATLLSGAGAIFYSAGTQSSTIVSMGASEILLSGSVSSDTTVAGGTIVVLPGAQVTGTTNDAGTVISTGVVLASGGLVVSAAPSATGYAVTAGEQLYVLPTGTTTSAMINGGSEEVTSGGTALYSTISGGQDLIDAGGTTTSATLIADATETVNGTANATTVSDYSRQTVSSGGLASGAFVLSSGDQLVAGGTADGTTVGSLGTQYVFSGLASGTVVASGGQQSVNGGTASGTLVASGGEVDVNAGSGVDATISSGGVEYDYGGVASGTHVLSGATEFVYSGGTATNAVVDAGAFQVVYPSGAATGTTGAGTVVSTGVVVISGNEAIATKPTATGDVITDGFRYDVLPTGSTSFVTISGGEEDLYAGATATSTTISAGGQIVVNSGGTAVSDVVTLGRETINAGGVASGSVVQSGGSVTDYGTTSGMHLGQGYASIYGSAANTSVGSGGSLYVYSSFANSGFGPRAVANAVSTSGVQTTNTFVGSGGFEYVSGGSVLDTTVGNGGTEVLQVFATSTGYAIEGAATGTRVLAGGSIELDRFLYVSGATASIDSATDILTVTEGGRTYTQQLAGDYTGETVGVSAGGIGGTIVTVFCFAAGTRIRTARGDVAVEALRVGDRAVTASGRLRAVRWLGHRVMDCATQAMPSQVQPICVAAGAFGAGLPERDLYLSPGHPVLVGADADGEGGHLVPIMCLINGTSVRRVPVDTVTYWHVELDAHDILLAEGLPAESYLELGDRSFFGEAAVDPLANPDVVMPGLPGRCRPVAIDGPVVDAAHRRLDAVFAARLAGACAWPDDAAWHP